MIKKVVFYNTCHIGDIHISRGLVKKMVQLCNAMGIECEYFHVNDPSLLADIPSLKHNRSYGIHDPYTLSRIDGEIAFINTWYLGTPGIDGGLTFERLYYSFVENAKLVGIDLTQYSLIDLFPSIDYSFYEVDKARTWLGEHTGKKVFISNGNALSGQSTNFPFSGVINTLAAERPDISFLISNEDAAIANRQNVFFTRQIIQKNGFDLNENAFLEENCDLIVGRMSGAYSFAMNRNCYFDNPRKFLAITNLDPNWVSWVSEITPTATFLAFNYNTAEQTTVAIRDNLPCK